MYSTAVKRNGNENIKNTKQIIVSINHVNKVSFSKGLVQIFVYYNQICLIRKKQEKVGVDD